MGVALGMLLRIGAIIGSSLSLYLLPPFVPREMRFFFQFLHRNAIHIVWSQGGKFPEETEFVVFLTTSCQMALGAIW